MSQIDRVKNLLATNTELRKQFATLLGLHQKRTALRDEISKLRRRVGRQLAAPANEDDDEGPHRRQRRYDEREALNVIVRLPNGVLAIVTLDELGSAEAVDVSIEDFADGALGFELDLSNVL